MDVEKAPKGGFFYFPSSINGSEQGENVSL